MNANMENKDQLKFLKSKCIILTTLCNNQCKNCLLEGNLKREHNDLAQIRGQLIKGIEESYERAIILGGEPTIHPNFLKIIRLAKEIGYKNITILSNGRMFSYMGFLKETIDAGANEIVVSIYSNNPDTHDSITCVKGSFDQTLNALMNMKKLNYPRIVGTVVTKQNYQDLPQLSNMLAGIGVINHQFEFIRPVGKAQDNYSVMVPRIKEVARYLEEAIKIDIENKINVRIESVPPCIMEEYSPYINTIKEESINQISEEDIKDHIKPKDCQACRYDKVCVGIWKEYAEREGFEEFIPVKH